MTLFLSKVQAANLRWQGFGHKGKGLGRTPLGGCIRPLLEGFRGTGTKLIWLVPGMG